MADLRDEIAQELRKDEEELAKLQPQVSTLQQRILMNRAAIRALEVQKARDEEAKVNATKAAEEAK